MTQKYLVLICLDVILIASFEDIDRAQKDYIQNLWEPEKIPVKVIEIRQYFDSDTIDKGFHVSVVDQDQLIKFSDYKPTELIQISTETGLMVWDLDKLEEIWCVRGYDQFNSSEKNFVRIGSNSLVPRRIVEKSKIVKSVTKNSESTVFCIPKIPNQQIGSCFTLYSALDVHEWQFIQNQFKRQRLVKRVDDQAVTAEIQGMSIFQFFKEEPDLFTLIREKIESKQLEQICTIDGMMFDHIYIRQIFYLLQLPLFGEKSAERRSFLSKIHQNRDIALSMLEQGKEKLNEYLRKLREENRRNTSEKKTNTIIQSCIKSKTNANTKLLEPLLELLLLSSECSLTNVVTDLQSLKCLLNLDSPAIQDFFEKSFIETQMTANISDIEMDYLLGEDNYLSFEGNSSQFSEQYIMERLETVKADQFDHFTSLKILKCFCKTRINKQKEFRSSNWFDVFDKQLEAIQNQNKIADALFNFFRKRLYIQKLKQVKIRIVEVDWVKQEGFNLIYYLAALNSREEEKFFDNELIRMLMRHKFKDESMQWVLKCTYIVYMALTLWYLTYWVTFSFQPDNTDDYDNIKTLSLAFFICIMILTVYLFTVEMKQIFRAGRLPSVWNFLHLFNYLFNAAILIADVSLRAQDQQDQQMNIDLVFCASFSSVLLWANLYHIVQTFTGMSFYVHLIFEAVKDSILFLVILFIGVFMFSNVILIFDFALKYYPCDGADFEHQGLIPEQSDSDIFDSILNMYQMTQGNFDTDNFSGIGSGIAFGRYNYVRGFIWAVYIIATFFLVITLLNVLIAIINETYNNVMQNRQRYDLMQRTIGLADFRLFPSVKKGKQFGQRYLYFLDPVDLNEEKNQSVYSNFSKLKQMIAKGNYIQTQLSTEATTNKSEVRQIQRKLDDIDEKFNQPKGTQGGTQNSQQLRTIFDKLEENNTSESRQLQGKVGQLEKNLDQKVAEIQSQIDQKNSVLEKTIKSEVTAVQSDISELNRELTRKVQGLESGISMLQQTMVSMLREMNDRI